jgi:hypothetical protein
MGEVVREGTGIARATARGFGPKRAPRHGEEVRDRTEISDEMCAAARQPRSAREESADSAAQVQLRSCIRQLTGPAQWRFAGGGAHFRRVDVRRRTFAGAAVYDG